jgi:hypothetical protein
VNPAELAKMLYELSKQQEHIKAQQLQLRLSLVNNRSLHQLVHKELKRITNEVKENGIPQ